MAADVEAVLDGLDVLELVVAVLDVEVAADVVEREDEEEDEVVAVGVEPLPPMAIVAPPRPTVKRRLARTSRALLAASLKMFASARVAETRRRGSRARPNKTMPGDEGGDQLRGERRQCKGLRCTYEDVWRGEVQRRGLCDYGDECDGWWLGAQDGSDGDGGEKDKSQPASQGPHRPHLTSIAAWRDPNASHQHFLGLS